MKTKTAAFEALLELANHYPSPHNGQPIRLKQSGDESFTLYFELERGLQATDISFIFSFVSMGVFMRHLELAAKALGHQLTYELRLPDQAQLAGKGLVEFATGRIQWNIGAESAELLRTLQTRQTSRKKYTAGLPSTLSQSLITAVAARGLALRQLDREQSRQTIWLNQRAVFDDMFDEPVRQELDHWLRYSRQQKQATRDGLAYDCMELNGWVMKRIIDHPGVLRWPGVSGLLQQYYLRSMTDNSSVLYMLAPFGTEGNAFDVGVAIMDVWTEIARQGYYLHPFGTIMSNHAAHRDFLQLAGVHDESRTSSYLVFIFRAGQSEPPVPSLRLPYRQHLLME